MSPRSFILAPPVISGAADEDGLTEERRRYFQPKSLSVGRHDDPLEREADYAADAVLRMPDSTAASDASAPQETSKVEEAAPGRGGGEALSPRDRAFFEPRFGLDFSRVNIHTGPAADAAARSIGALAYTHGEDIVFQRGRYAPETEQGRRLLVHELAHVAQGYEGRTRDAVVLRAPDPKDDIEQRMNSNDWHGAAKALAEQDPAAIEARVRAMPSARRQYLVEGARHGEGIWNASAVIDVVDRVDHRDAVIGSVRFYVWKHMWAQAGTFLCGLNNPDIRRVAGQLKLTWDDLHAIVNEQPDKSQQSRLSEAFFTDLEFFKKIPRDLVNKDAEQLSASWLGMDEIVGPYAAAKWSKGGKPKVTVVPFDSWSDVYGQHSTGRFDPELGRERTAEDSKKRAVLVEGFTDVEKNEIYLREGNNTPGRLIHEAVHALAPKEFEESLGTAVNEGTTEYFARRVARSAGKHPSSAYSDEYAGVAALAAVAGEPLLAESFFNGKTLKLEMVVDQARRDGTFKAWNDAMRDENQRKNAPKLLERGGSGEPDGR